MSWLSLILTSDSGSAFVDVVLLSVDVDHDQIVTGRRWPCLPGGEARTNSGVETLVTEVEAVCQRGFLCSHFHSGPYQSRAGWDNLFNPHMNHRLTRLPASFCQIEVLLAEFMVLLWQKDNQGILRDLLGHLGMLEQVEVKLC